MSFEYWIEPDTGIFVGEFKGKVKLPEIAAALANCFAQPQPVKAMWLVEHMEVDFALEEVTRLAEHATHSLSAPGQMAFVHGEQQFILAVINSVRNMRSIWKTHWQSFEDQSLARAWLQEGYSRVDNLAEDQL